MGESLLHAAYVAGHALTALFTLGMGLWFVRRTEMHGRYVFGLLFGVGALWSILSSVSLLVTQEGLQLWLRVLWTICAVGIAYLLLVSAAVYTGRDWRRNRVVQVAGLVFVGLIPIILAAPFHDLYWTEVEVPTSPFPHFHGDYGPFRLIGVTYNIVIAGIVLYYFVELYQRSRHRPSKAMLVLATGVALSVAIFVLSELFLVETYDHSSFVVPVAAIAYGYAAFRFDMATVVPVARDQAIADLSDPFLVVTDQRRLVDFNPAAAQLFDRVGPKRIGAPLGDVVPKVADELEPDEDEQSTGEIRIQNEGEPRHFDVNSSVIRGPRGDRRGTQILLRDVTALRKREQELQAKTDRLDQFASVISHDLRNPLEIADLYLDFAQDTGDPEDFEAVETAHERMDRMIEDLLALARAETAEITSEPITLAAAAEAAWETAQTGECDLAVTVPEDWTIEGDPDLLRNVLENLFRNAAVHNAEPVTVTVGALDGNPSGFFVEDDGTGIPASERDEIFEHGYTTSDDGSGLGLAIVQDFLDHQGFEIHVTESDAGGARFEVQQRS